MHFIFARLPVLLTSNPAEDNIQIEEGLGAGKFGLHDVLAAKSFSCRNNSLRNRCWIGGKDDWLVITDKACDMKLFNPVVGVNVCLPSFNTITSVHVDDYNELEIVYAPISRSLHRVVFCRTPRSRNGYFAIAFVLGWSNGIHVREH